MFEYGFKLTQDFVINIVIIHIVALLIVNYLSKNEFSLLTLIIGPAVAGAAIFYGDQLATQHLSMQIPWLFTAVTAFILYGLILFFIMGFDPQRHHSNMVSVAFFSLLLTLAVFTALYQQDLVELPVIKLK